MTVGTRIAVAKQCNYKVWYHVTASFNNSNSAVPMAVIILKFIAAVEIPNKKHKGTMVSSFGFQSHVHKHFLRRLSVLLQAAELTMKQEMPTKQRLTN